MKRLAVLLGLLFLGPVLADDSGVEYDPAAAMFPDPAEIAAAVDKAGKNPHATIYEMGSSQGGNPIRLVEYILPGIPVDDRVVSFIMTQQHGNEPAGTPAALSLFDRIDAGEFDAALANQVLLVLPQANPDGSVANRRTADDGTDINRDHIGLTTPESQALHAVLNHWDVHMGFDHHEYGGVGLGEPVPVRAYDWDITTMLPNHGNVRSPTAELAATLNYDHIYPYVQGEGYSIGDYGVQGVGVSNTPQGNVFVPIQQTAGGPDPGILRNAFGLNNVVGLLVETFISSAETPFQSFDRRVGAHTAVMEAVIQFGHEYADELIATKAESARLNLEQTPTEYIEGDIRGPMGQWWEVEGGLDELMALHGLPLAHAGAPERGYGPFYGIPNERAGLLGAILNPLSTRNVGDAIPLQHEPVFADDGSNDEIDKATPIIPLFAVVGLLGLLASRRRSS